MSKVLSTHVLDSTTGNPAQGVHVQLCASDGSPISQATTDSDGRVVELATAGLTPGIYRLIFDTGTYFESIGQETFYPEVTVTFRIDNTSRGYHVPLLLSPFAYSTYRGS
ncbi:hydroxyisourate hydrolase [Rhodococcus sp. NPDC056743]|uniref:hydroxyisourate hydrolase n=1 Tax=Rhodococcus sp. NPDC056743 TaxID=3345934 RepID=UPI00366C76D8